MFTKGFRNGERGDEDTNLLRGILRSQLLAVGLEADLLRIATDGAGVGLERIEDVLERGVQTEGEQHAGVVDVVGVLDDDGDSVVLSRDLVMCVLGHDPVALHGLVVVAVERRRRRGGTVGRQRPVGLGAGAARGRHVEFENDHG